MRAKLHFLCLPVMSIVLCLPTTQARAMDGVCVRYCHLPGSGWLPWAFWAGQVAGQILANQAAQQRPVPPPAQRQQRRIQPTEKPRTPVVARTSHPSGPRPMPGTKSSQPANWVDCHASGGVWGRNGSCGKPDQLASLSEPGSWTYITIPTTTTTGPEGARWASVPAIGLNTRAQSPSPPPSPTANRSDSTNCLGPRAGTAMFGIPGSPDAPNLNCSDNVPALGTWETAAPAEIAMIDAAGTSLPADPTCALNGVSCIDQQLDCGGAVGTLRVTYAKSDNASGQAPYIKFTYTGPNAKNISM